MKTKKSIIKNILILVVFLAGVFAVTKLALATTNCLPSITFSTTPQTSQTSPFVTGDQTTTTWQFTPWSYFQGYDWTFKSETTDTVTGAVVNDADFLASWSDIVAQNLCNSTGYCTLTASFEASQFQCTTNVNNIRKREDWTVANGIESNHRVFYFRCSDAVTPSITVLKAGSGSGTVTSNPAGISCGSTCSASYTYGTSVTLTASASSGSTFAGWSGEGCSGTGTCAVSMTQARNVTAAFSICGCYPLTFNSANSHILPSSVGPNGSYTMSCDYGALVDCIFPSVPSGSCSWTGFTGTAANFSCTAGSGSGTFNGYCATFSTSKNCCSYKNSVGTLTVASITFSRTPQTSQTSPFVAGDQTTANWQFTPWSYFQGYNWTFKSKTTDTVTGASVNDADFIAGWNDIVAQNLCNNSGYCSMTGTWQASQFQCSTNVNNIRKREEWTVANGVESNHNVFYFKCSDTCSDTTTVGETQATLVGEVTDTGGDPNLEVWFQYGKTTSYGSETTHQSKYGTGLFCTTVYNLDPCTTYHYRAVARNSASTSYGEDKTFTTTCSLVSVDIKANNSNGPVNLYYGDNVTLSWTSQNVASCSASGDWSGSKSTSGSQTIQLNSVKTYTFTITCQNSNGSQTATDSVQVNVSPKPPVVITKPAIVTY